MRDPLYTILELLVVIVLAIVIMALLGLRIDLH